MRERPGPAEKFQSLDADGNGSLDRTELSELARELSKMAGRTLEVDSALTTYDSDGDSMLSKSKMGTMMGELMGPPPGGPSGPPAPPPGGGEKFAEFDSDGSGGLSESELEALAEDLSSVTGGSIVVREAFSSYDADGDGELSQEELETMMQAQRKENGDPPPHPPGEDAASGLRRQAVDAYRANAGDDQITRLKNFLQQLVDSQSAGNGTTSA